MARLALKFALSLAITAASTIGNWRADSDLASARRGHAVRLLCDDAVLGSWLLRSRRQGYVVAGMCGRIRRRLRRPRSFGRTTNIVRTPNLAWEGTRHPPNSMTSMASTRTIASRPTNTANHGTCTGLSPQDYFATVRSVRARLKIPAMFQAPSDQLHMGPEEIEQAFMTANPNLRPTIWRSAAAMANSSTCASAWRRIFRLTPSAGRSRATPASARRSSWPRCVEQWDGGVRVRRGACPRCRRGSLAADMG